MTLPTSADSPRPTGPAGSGPGNGRALLVVLVGLAVLGGLIAVLLTRDDDSEPATDELTTATTTAPLETSTSEPPDTTPTSTEPVAPPDDTGAQVVGPETSEMARAAVLLLQLDSEGNPVCYSGSGSIVSPEGQILTNAHVVWNDPTCPYEQLGVATVDATDSPPTLRYLADIVAYDDLVDLAVAQISTDLDGNPVGDLALPHVAIGDSSTVDLGDSLRILGFPGIGGNTITFTTGAVSGFIAQRGVDDVRAWIKTDATIAGGNSGGMAVNDAGELVAVPTTAGSGDADSATTDCRFIQDTNGDGSIDAADSCIPIGGFINGLRPVNLALPLLADAADGVPVEPVSPDTVPPSEFDVAAVVVDNVYFAPGVTADDQPTEIVHALPSGVDQVCAFWTYSGMQDGVTYDAIWRIDGTPDADASFVDDTWVGGESGEWWVCVVNDTGVVDGLYEFEFSAEGVFLASEAIFVGGDRSPATITVENQTDQFICYVQISPTLAGYWGGDELGPTEVIDPSASRVFDQLVTGQYDVIVRDCDGEPLQEWTGLDVTGDETLSYSG